jgi:hypothetical protein
MVPFVSTTKHVSEVYLPHGVHGSRVNTQCKRDIKGHASKTQHLTEHVPLPSPPFDPRTGTDPVSSSCDFAECETVDKVQETRNLKSNITQKPLKLICEELRQKGKTRTEQIWQFSVTWHLNEI